MNQGLALLFNFRQKAYKVTINFEHKVNFSALLETARMFKIKHDRLDGDSIHPHAFDFMYRSSNSGGKVKKITSDETLAIALDEIAQNR